MIPSRRVEAGALERFEALELGDVRVVENAGRGNHQVEPVAIAGGGGQVPLSVHIDQAHDLVAEADQGQHAMVARHALEIGEKFLRSEERRVGKEGVSTCRYRWSQYN